MTGCSSARRTGKGKIIAGGTTYVVAFRETEDGDLARVDAACRAKYGRYASIVDHFEQAGLREERTVDVEGSPARLVGQIGLDATVYGTRAGS